MVRMRQSVWGVAAFAAVAAYFLYFAFSAVHAGFAGDDPMNLGLYWTRGFFRSVVDGMEIWSEAYRPVGAMFYLPIYHAFGLNPVPYRLAVFAILAANTYLTFRFANGVLRSNAAAVLAAVMVCAHGNMTELYLNTSQIYDLLAYLFSITLLICYAAFRREGRDLTAVQWFAIVCLYLAAVGSKEIALPVALWILAYELLFQPSWKLGAPLVLLGISAVSAAGKVIGAQALSKSQGYLMEVTLHRYLFNNRQYLNDLFYTSYFDSSRKLLICWGILVLICCLVRRRELWWICLVTMTATLPLSFTVQPRGGPALYLPWLGWVLFTGAVVAALPRRFALQAIAVVLLAFGCMFQAVRSWRYAVPAYLEDHRPTMSVIAQLSNLPARPAHNSRVIFLSNPLPNWATYFIASLLWNDRSIDIQLADRSIPPPTQSAVENADWILDFKGEKLSIVKAPSPR